MKQAVVLGAALVAFAAGPLPAPAAADSAAAVAAKAASTYDTDRAGVIGVAIDYESKTDAAVFHQTTHERRWRVMRDGTTVAGGVGWSQIDGKLQPAGKLADESQSFDATVKREPLHTPLRAKYQGEYQFADTTCEGCAPGQRAVRFATTQHDALHVEGTLIVDAAGRPVRVVFRPFVFPKYADEGTATETFGPALEGKRFVVTSEGNYRGRQGLVSGTMRVTARNTYHRFATVEEATAALERESRVIRTLQGP